MFAILDNWLLFTPSYLKFVTVDRCSSGILVILLSDKVRICSDVPIGDTSGT